MTATPDLATKFRDFVKLEGRAYSSLYERLSLIIADDPRLLAILGHAPAHQRQPTLLYAALHDLVLSHPQEALARWYPTVTQGPVPDEDPGPALREFCAKHEGELQRMVATRSTQTNEVGRCIALVLAFDLIATEVPKPLGLVELGASAGLNLLFDRYHYDYEHIRTLGDETSLVRLRTSFRGAKRPWMPAALPAAGRRIGVDLEPIDVRDGAATQWLQACVFGDQLERQQRLRAALDLARSAPPDLRRGDFIALLPGAAADIPPDQHLCLVTAWAVHYLTADQRRTLDRVVEGIGQSRDLSWVAAEPMGVMSQVNEPPPNPQHHLPTLLSLTTIRNGVREGRVLARMHSHAAWIEWLDV
ncbi:MAG TPA: DUF2332 domain-containing protein [Alphaproteobacteria bacterium]